MIEKLVEELLQKYPPEPLIESRGWSTAVAREVWERLRYASEVARRNGQEFDYQLCRHFSDLFWAVENRNTGLILEVLLGIPDVIDLLDESERAQADWNELYYLCYGLVSLDGSKGRKIYFYTEALEGIRNNIHYWKFFHLLYRLHGKVPGHFLVASIRYEVSTTELPSFEKKMVDILLQDLEKPVEKE